MRTFALMIVVTALALPGCVSPGNDRMSLGERTHLEVFGGPRPETAPSPSEQVMAPSLTGINRGHWARTQIAVPVDGLVHFRTYARRTFWADKAVRQRGENPTAASALELYAGSEEQQEYEALNNQFRAITDVLLLVPRALVWVPWKPRQSPDESYQRYWHPERPAGASPTDPPSVSP